MRPSFQQGFAEIRGGRNDDGKAKLESGKVSLPIVKELRAEHDLEADTLTL